MSLVEVCLNLIIVSVFDLQFFTTSHQMHSSWRFFPHYGRVRALYSQLLLPLAVELPSLSQAYGVWFFHRIFNFFRRGPALGSFCSSWDFLYSTQYVEGI